MPKTTNILPFHPKKSTSPDPSHPPVTLVDLNISDIPDEKLLDLLKTAEHGNEMERIEALQSLHAIAYLACLTLQSAKSDPLSPSIRVIAQHELECLKALFFHESEEIHR